MLERTLPRESYLSPEVFAQEQERIFWREWFVRRARGGGAVAGRLRRQARRGREHPRRADARGVLRRTTTSAATAARSWCPTAARAPSPAASAARTTPGPTRSTASSAPRRSSTRATVSRRDQLSPVSGRRRDVGRLRLREPHAGRAHAADTPSPRGSTRVPERTPRTTRSPSSGSARRITYERRGQLEGRCSRTTTSATTAGRCTPSSAGSCRRSSSAAARELDWDARHPAPRGRLDVHGHRDDDPARRSRASRGRTRPAQGRADLPEPHAEPLRGPRGGVHALAARRRPHARSSTTSCSTPTRSRSPTSLRPTRWTSGTW